MTRREQIQELANNLHIALYIREDGNAYQYPPGEAVVPQVPWPTPFYSTYSSDPEPEASAP